MKFLNQRKKKRASELFLEPFNGMTVEKTFDLMRVMDRAFVDFLSIKIDSLAFWNACGVNIKGVNVQIFKMN